jgi:hypothetical protein
MYSPVQFFRANFYMAAKVIGYKCRRGSNMGERDKLASNQGYMLYYRRPVQSRNKKLWLCYINDEDKWALSTSPYFPKSVDLGYRFNNRTEGVIALNMVSTHKFGSDEMFTAIDKCRAALARTRKPVPQNVN